MDHDTFRDVARRLGHRGTALPTLLVLLVDALVTCVVVVLASQGCLLLKVGATLLHSLVLLHCALIEHECVHGTVLARPKHNDALGHVLGFLTLTPHHIRKRDHLAHHRAPAQRNEPTNARASATLARLTPGMHVLLDVLWRAYIPVLALHEKAGLWRASFARSDGIVRTGAYAVGYVVALLLLARHGALATALGVHGVAFLLLQAYDELLNLCHHLDVPLTPQRLHAREQARVTQSCRAVPFWSRFVTLWSGLHQAHHVWPRVPWFALPEAQKTLATQGESEPGPCEFTWSVRKRRAPFAQAFQVYLPPSPRAESEPRRQDASHIEQ